MNKPNTPDTGSTPSSNASKTQSQTLPASSPVPGAAIVDPPATSAVPTATPKEAINGPFTQIPPKEGTPSLVAAASHNKAMSEQQGAV